MKLTAGRVAAWATFVATVWLSLGAGAQAAEPERYSLRRLVEEAWQKYPTVAAARAALGAASGSVQIARDEYLPSASVHAELTHATRNNILGAMLPNQTIPPVTGLAPNGPSGRGVWGNAMGVLLSWTAYDFGTRRAKLEFARAALGEAQARLDLVRYEVADQVADAWFRTIAAEQAERAFAASVKRWETALGAVSVLVASGLRPGADASRLRAELARAEASLFAAQEQTRHAQVELARFLLEPEKPIALRSDWVMRPYLGSESEGNAVRHPLLTVRAAEVSNLAAHAVLATREWLPKVVLYSSASGRGTGARNNGDFRDGAAGLYPDTGNWALGAGVTLDLFDWKRSRSRKEMRDYRVEEARAQETEASIALRSMAEQARASLIAARSIAGKTPEALAAAQELLAQSEARYQTGLGTITELAEAQRTLQQAEVDDALAKVGVWRAAYGVAAARGELQAFLDQTP